MNIKFDTSVFIDGEEIEVTVHANVYEETEGDDQNQSTYLVADINRIVSSEGKETCVPADQHGYLEDEALTEAEMQDDYAMENRAENMREERDLREGRL